MSLKETVNHLRELLSNITSDLEKADGGNKAASQRVRTGTVKLEKVAKVYRKESISNEKKTKGQKKPTKSAATKKAAPKGKHAESKPAAHSKSSSHSKPAANAKKAVVKSKPKAKTTSFRARQLSAKRASAKLPTRRFSSAR